MQSATRSAEIGFTEPANALVSFGHTHIGGRTTLSLRTTEKPEFRVMKSRGSAGFTLVLADTANQLDPSPVMSGGLVRSVEVTSVGEDLIVQIATRHSEAEVRSKTGYDRIRGEHLFSLDLTEPGVRLPGPAVIRREVGRFAFTLGDRCHERFEEVLRERLDAESLARASRSMGGLTDLYRREAMLRLGRLDHGQVWTLSGERFRTGSALELEVALQSASSIPGYLALLGAYARTQEDSGTVLRSLVVPDLDAATFAPIHEAAEAAWRGCRRARSR